MEIKNNASEVVLSYIRALDHKEYDEAARYLGKDIRIIGNARESFSKTGEFINMLRQHQGRYKLKKTFTGGDDVCLFYDLVTPAAKVFMCSWYHVVDGKISSIQSVFDPQQFPEP